MHEDNLLPRLPKLAIVAAMSRDRLIGRGLALPWQLPGELRHFSRLTRNGVLLMGRKTYESIGRPLPGRINMVLSRSCKELPGVEVFPGVMPALRAATATGRPVFIIGGEELYRQTLPIAAELHISWIEGHYTGDRFFPPIDEAHWTRVSREQHPGFVYIRYQRHPVP